MLGLTIEKIYIEVKTNGGNFLANIPLTKGLNVIRAENSSGKSTCVNAIAYGLGLEQILGPRGRRPFPKSLYEEIYLGKDNQTPYFVNSSRISLTISNSQGVSVITSRDVLGDDKKVSVTLNGETNDYFLGSSGNVGSAKSERGFHHWLANFLGWKLPDVVTFDGNETKLYLECIFPLFFIEQKRGWSEIQANLPSYGIKNVKKAAIEFCLGIDSFENEKKINQLRQSIDHAEAEWEKLRSSAEGIADFNSVLLNRVPDIKEYKDSFAVEFLYQEGDTTYSVFERERAIKKQIGQIEKDISLTTPNNDKMNRQQAILRKLNSELENISNDIGVQMLSLSDVDSKLMTLRSELDRYHQLRKLKSVGGSIEAELDTKKCPICESDLYDTLGNRSVKREPMTLDENIDFLKNQTDFYKNIRDNTHQALNKLHAQSKLLTTRIEKEQSILNDLRDDINDINGEAKALIRSKIQLEIELKETIKLGASLGDLKGQAARIHNSWLSNTEALKKFKSQASSHDRSLVIRELLSLIKENLRDFNFTPASIGTITISEQSLRPEQEGYDIVAETSASDYIRIIWAYTLALLQLAGQKDDVLHGGFIVFDEPRQHEASKISFTNLIKKASETKTFNGQVIFATSLDVAEIQTSCVGKDVNLFCFTDYILSLENPSS